VGLGLVTVSLTKMLTEVNRINAIGYGDNFLRESMCGLSVASLDEPPALIEVNNALYVPGLGGLYRQDGDLIPESTFFYFRGANLVELLKAPGMPVPGAIDPSAYAFEDFEDKTLFAGILGTHYGHFITDHVARLWPIDQFDDSLPLLFIPQNDSVFSKSYIAKLFAMGGINSNRFLKTSRPLRLKRAMVPEPSIQYNKRIHSCHDWFHRRVTANMEIPDWPTSSARVYLTRTKLGASKWKIAGEEALEHQLSSFGFQVIAPEALSLEKQVQIFNSRAMVLGSIGSSFHSALFAAEQPGKRIGILAHAKVNGRFLLIDSIKRNYVTYFNALTTNSIRSANARDSSIDVEMVLAMLRQDGWL
jgi:Glycosyltransferase 61